MTVWLTPKALSFSNQPPSLGIWVPAFAGMSGTRERSRSRSLSWATASTPAALSLTQSC